MATFVGVYVMFASVVQTNKGSEHKHRITRREKETRRRGDEKTRSTAIS
jgi:hypothetical protein